MIDWDSRLVQLVQKIDGKFYVADGSTDSLKTQFITGAMIEAECESIAEEEARKLYDRIIRGFSKDIRANSFIILKHIYNGDFRPKHSPSENVWAVNYLWIAEERAKKARNRITIRDEIEGKITGSASYS